ncbi:hypothetical protein [Cellulosimicrobium aquatile]|uniref:hypothetical protein n=1 Tax=Cellulosimicrobium aquatile TaxID=1612203 RepID=UPI0014598C5B|nr:hypothetical protein [Cellulosimicrobium aquatile]NMF30049.1 hypothetical protein [Cellulosimicrobium aquatile]
MRCATGLGTTAAVAALLLAGASGTTHALWRDEALTTAAVVRSGSLDVELEPQGETAPVLLVPDGRVTVDYRLAATLGGDNLDARLRLGLPTWRDVPLLDYVDVTLELRREGAEVATGTLDAQGQVLFGGSPDVPVDLATGTTTLDVTLAVQMDWDVSGHWQTALPDGDLVADLWQVRTDDDAVDDARLWRDTQGAPAPSIVTGPQTAAATETVPAPDTAVPAPDVVTTTPEVPPTTGAPAGDAPTGDAPTSGGPTPVAPVAPGAPGAAPDGPAVAADDPPWATELRTLLEDLGIDPATLDPDVLDLGRLPVEVEQWAADRSVPTTDVVAWLREQRP